MLQGNGKIPTRSVSLVASHGLDMASCPREGSFGIAEVFLDAGQPVTGGGLAPLRHAPGVHPIAQRLLVRRAGLHKVACPAETTPEHFPCNGHRATLVGLHRLGQQILSHLDRLRPSCEFLEAPGAPTQCAVHPEGILCGPCLDERSVELPECLFVTIDRGKRLSHPHE